MTSWVNFNGILNPISGYKKSKAQQATCIVCMLEEIGLLLAKRYIKT
jgi:hypothetical protein